jgi:hypothetical protein
MVEEVSDEKKVVVCFLRTCFTKLLEGGEREEMKKESKRY